MRRLARRLFGIPLSEVRAERRGFQTTDASVRARLEAIGEAFVQGYHTALEEPRPDRLAKRLEAVDLERRGFAFEGAAMGLAVVDSFAIWRAPDWRAFLDGPGDAHAYMVHVGAGWAMARLGAPAHRVVAVMDPLLRWLAYDGFGFHEGYFRWSRYAAGGAAPASLRGYARRAFDQGLGRSMWFVSGADPARASAAIAAFPDTRRRDLWSGVGLACAYAGGTERTAIESLRQAAGPHRGWLAQGVAFAAKARQRAGNPAAHTRMACEVLCGRNDEAAARVTDVALAATAGPVETPGADFDRWRQRVRDSLAESGPAVTAGAA